MTEKSEALVLLLEKRRFEHVRAMVAEMNAVDIAELLEDLDDGQLLLAYRLLPKEMAAEIFSYMAGDTQEKLLGVLTNQELAAVMDGLYLDDAADLLEEMPANVVKRLLQMTSPEDRRRLNQLLKYPDGSAGGVLTTEFVDLKAAMTVAEAFQYIRECGPDKETIYTCYVIDRNRRLEGVITVKELLLASGEQLVGDLMEEHVISAVTTDDQETVAQLFAKYDLMALPVVDSENRLVGIITVDDVVDILQQEATEDMEKMAAITPTEKPYWRVGVWETFKTRFPWLLLLMVSATFTGMIITSFEEALSASVALTAFIPMLMDTGGNTGSQASVTVVRGLALGDIRVRDILRVMFKELRVGVLCGVCLSAAMFAKILLIDRLLLGGPVTVMEAVVVCVTLLATIVCAKLVGCSLPLIAKKIGFDPAVMAGPFITTAVDAISLLVYFRMATVLLHLT
ncbi:MAG: magnesium transporter [Clostridia bacterium]|nr:magnesium transporter [Clostridia bacterium]